MDYVVTECIELASMMAEGPGSLCWGSSSIACTLLPRLGVSIVMFGPLYLTSDFMRHDLVAIKLPVFLKEGHKCAGFVWRGNQYSGVYQENNY